MWLTFTSGGEEGTSVQATGERFIIGRDDGCDLVVADERASRQHAYLRILGNGRAELHDLGSANGTFVNGHRITGPVMLSGGEQLQFGNTTLTTSLREPSDNATMIGVTPAGLGTVVDAPPETAGITGASGSTPPAGPEPSGAGRTPTPSTIERIKLRKSVRTATVLAATAVAAAVVVVVLFATGVFSSDETDEPDVPEIVAQVAPSTVVVFSEVNGEIQGNGTGWVLDADEGLIVTNAHVVNGGETFSVGVDDQQRDASVVGVATCDDLAVLRVGDTSDLVTLPLLDSQSDLRQGERVVALGFPGSASLSSNLTTTTGVVSVVQTSFDLQAVDVPQYPNVIQTDTVINPGNSGGPLVNHKGELVGVNSAGITLLGGRTIQGQGYAVGIDRVKEIVPLLAEGRSLGWSGMGFTYIEDPSEFEEEFRSSGFPLVPGLVVLTATEGTPAEEAGFGQRPVLVTDVNGTSMDGGLPTYCTALGDAEQAQEATFTVVQEGATSSQDVTVRFP
ncbi:MAG: trypsin-like peptidase domain-containing protein [Miltoncostaeaceae bacterium]